MRKGLFTSIAAVLLALAAGSASAQEETVETDGYATVIGIAPGDLLNIRAAASATGIVIARVPNGTLLKVDECTMATGNLWCKVVNESDPATNGWSPARYLSGYEDRSLEELAQEPAYLDEMSIMSSDTSLGPDVAEPAPDERERGSVASFYTAPFSSGGPADLPLFAGGDDPRARGLTGGARVKTLIALPVVPGEGDDLVPMPLPEEVSAPTPNMPEMAALSDGEVEEGDGSSPEPVAEVPAMSDTEGAAAPPVEEGEGQPVAAERPEDVDVRPADPQSSAPIAAEIPAQPMPESAAADLENSSAPSRFQQMAVALRGLFDGEKDETVEVATGVPEIMSAPVETGRAQAAGETADAGAQAQIPCARYLGQPMTMCRASVVRHGPLAADVTVIWPDGGNRTIRFREGRVEGSDASHPFRAVREADLNMIRIGRSERFEVTDALAFGG